MALTFGTGPFGDEPTGRFDVDPPPRPLMFWEPYRKRLRIVAGGELVVDSRNVLALHETGKFMRLCVPWSDVRRDKLTIGASKDDGLAGTVRQWSLQTAKGIADGALTSFESPPRSATDLRDLVCIDLELVDAWYLEDDLGYAQPRNPYHRFDVHRASRRVVVRAGETLLAEANECAMLFETSTPPRFYLPPDALRTERLERSATVSQCPYKGDGQHWHALVPTGRIDDAAWSLTTPMGDALMIPRWFSFYPEKVSVEIDGERLQPANEKST